jgi:integrase
MATVKVKFRPSSIETKEGTLFYQVIHRRVARQIQAGYRLYAPEWERRLSEIVLPAPGNGREGYLRALKNRVEEDTGRLKRIIAGFEQKGEPYTAGNVVDRFRNPAKDTGFIAFTENLVAQLQRIGKARTGETYATAINSFRRFCGAGDVPADEMDSSLMVEYETWLKSGGLCPNTTSFYMRNLRAIYNRAVEKGVTAQQYPFRHVYTGIGRTVKRAVPLKTVRQIKEMDLTLRPSLDYARDMFLFSFLTRGMSFIDMAHLRKNDLKNGVLSYRRKKTGQQLFIKWEKPMQEIADKYDTEHIPYLLPIIRDAGGDAGRQYRNSAHFVNGKLKAIGKMLSLPLPLTMYVARHAWASIARSKNIPVAVISEAMGHDSEHTTRIYLASLDASAVDKTNSLILKSL